jgi:hypothetical protein
MKLPSSSMMSSVFGFSGLVYSGLFLVFLVGAIAAGTPPRKDDSSAIAQAFGVGSVLSFGVAFILKVSSDEPED